MVSGGANYNVGVTLNVGGTAGGAAGGAGTSQGKPKVRPKDPDGSKTLKTLTGAGASLVGLYKSSQVLQTYQKAMNSIVSVGFDLLFAALSPIFAVLLLLMTKLIGWLITSGLLDQIYKASMWIAEKIIDLVNWFSGWPWQTIRDAANYVAEKVQALYDWWSGLTWSEKVGTAMVTALGAWVIWKTLPAAIDKLLTWLGMKTATAGAGNAAGGASKASGLLGGAAKIAGGLAVEAELAGLLADQAKDKEGIIGTLERGMADIFSGAALHRWGTEGMARQESAWSLGGAIDATAIGLGAAMQWVSGVGDREIGRAHV